MIALSIGACLSDVTGNSLEQRPCLMQSFTTELFKQCWECGGAHGVHVPGSLVLEFGEIWNESMDFGTGWP